MTLERYAIDQKTGLRILCPFQMRIAGWPGELVCGKLFQAGLPPTRCTKDCPIYRWLEEEHNEAKGTLPGRTESGKT